MLAEMPSRLLSEWMAYFEIEPFGEERGDLRMGILAALIANINRDPKRARSFEPKDFMPKFGDDVREVPVEEKVKAIFGMMAKRNG